MTIISTASTASVRMSRQCHGTHNREADARGPRVDYCRHVLSVAAHQMWATN